MTLDNVKKLLSGSTKSIRPLAGGTDLIDQLRVDRRTADIVMDIKNINELNQLDYTNGTLNLGAAVSCTTVRKFQPIIDNYPALAESAGLVGSVQIQNRASIGGNVCNAAPSADTIPSLLIYSAIGVVIGPDGERKIPLENFFTGPSSTVLNPNEILVSIIIPPPPENSTSHYLRFIPREEMDIAVAGVGTMIAIDPATRQCVQARIALSAVSAIPKRATEAESILEGNVINEDLITEAGAKASIECTPIDDIRGTIEYRKELVKVLTRRTIRKCIEILN
jgi:carbon-monoxide dehydrogenase medium subunit